MKDLTTLQQAVWQAKTVDAKRDLTIKLINTSHATKQTKTKFLFKVQKMSAQQLDFFVTNYGFSGEGLSVK